MPGYEGAVVPAYLLWHPSDHHSATLTGKTGPGGTSREGAKIVIREAMQYDRYGWRYPVDSALAIFYVGPDGWGMGRKLPVLGEVMVLRIHFADVVAGGTHIGVHYHYEIVIGLSANNPLTRRINAKVSAEFGPEFFEAWQTHNVIEVGTFENFLPPLYAQRHDPANLRYSPDMNPVGPLPEGTTGYSRDRFHTRIAGFREAADPFGYQGYRAASFL